MKIYFAQHSNELFIKGQFAGDFTGMESAIKIMKCFDEEHYPARIFDPIAPPAIMGLSEDARNHIHNLEIDRILNAMNGAVSVDSERDGWESSPVVFLHDPEAGQIICQDLNATHPDVLEVEGPVDVE